MTTSEMPSFETWAFHPTFDNSWISETFTKSLTNVSTLENVSFLEPPTSFLIQPGSSSAGSDPDPDPDQEPDPEPETPSVSKRVTRNTNSKKITKRKTRASKRSTTTFINADPANFRQMVQQVTGVRFGSVQLPGLVLKPEPQRVESGSGLFLPTLDTSAFLLDHRQQVVGPTRKDGNGSNVGPGSGPGFDFDGLCCFPTLESWKVM